MKHFKQYLSESIKIYDFKIKVAGTITTEQENHMKALLDKYQVLSFRKAGKTPIQELPLDFPKVTCAEVHIFEVAIEYPVTGWELHTYLTDGLHIGKDNMVVRNPHDPTESYQENSMPRAEPLLMDPDYKEVENAKFEDFYGDKYNADFVKGLNARVKEMRKERSETIPGDINVKYNTDTTDKQASVLAQAKDPRK